MADLNTQQKAAIVIRDFYGNVLSSLEATFVIDPPGVVTGKNVSNAITLTAAAPGECDVTVTKAGSSGTLHVVVEPAPLTLTLGSPEPK